tara:strand:- start:602 stop:1195 length:594 start_codon:yes stop_codon:yes gene_type:complete
MNKSAIEGMKGHLEIWKVFPDGSEELHYSKENVITRGMGYTLAHLFNSAGTENVDNYQLQYFQLGTSGASSLQVSGTEGLSSVLPIADYGTPNFMISEHDRHIGMSSINHNTKAGVTEAYGIIPFSHIKKISPTRVMYQIVAGNSACNGQTLNEIGLFSKNPRSSSPRASALCAYRWFGDINKTDAFSLLFRWTIEF